MHKIELIGKLLGKSTTRAHDEFRAPAADFQAKVSYCGELVIEPLIVVGASTGGPHALAEILARLPGDLEAGIIIVQHVDAAFAPGLSEWLSAESRRRVTLIRRRASAQRARGSAFGH